MEEVPETLKIVLVGDGSSGKTSLVQRYTQDGFGKSYRQTVGLDFYQKRLELPGDRYITLQIWDIGGQSLGAKMISHYLENADGILLVYDITNLDSFENLDDWLTVVEANCIEKKPHISLVANKSDLKHMRVVKPEQHREFVEKHSCGTHLVCAKTGEQVAICFRQVVANITGISMTAREVEVAKAVVKAEIVEHPKAPVDNTSNPLPRHSRPPPPKSSRLCAVQ